MNVSAIEEYQEVKARYDALRAQVADVEGRQQNELTQMIASLSGQMREIFTDSFRAINENFAASSPSCSAAARPALCWRMKRRALLRHRHPGGAAGQGHQESGSPVRRRAGAGGHQHLFRHPRRQPRPFCILDEIEAALDDANVVRFAQYLRRVSDKTQFIVITHRRGTMEAANVLYGVTMQEDGVSKLLKLDLEQVDAELVS